MDSSDEGAADLTIVKPCAGAYKTVVIMITVVKNKRKKGKEIKFTGSTRFDLGTQGSQ